MRQFIILFLILTFLLTACGTLEVTLTNSDELTQTPAIGLPRGWFCPVGYGLHFGGDPPTAPRQSL